jgi:hypothetical protein
VHGIQTRERLHWRSPAIIGNYRSILSSERAPISTTQQLAKDNEN